MFFVLSKSVGFFATPSNLIILIGIVGLLLLPTRGQAENGNAGESTPRCGDEFF